MNADLWTNTITAAQRLWIEQSARFEEATPGAKALNAWVLPIMFATAMYLPICWTLKAFYKNRNPLPHRKPLILWNAILSILSLLGSVVVLVYHPGVPIRKADPVQNAIHPNVRFVVRVFCITKFVEYGDTFWLCVKKRPMIFLHLYHHITVTLYCLHSVLLDAPYGHLFAFVNLNIHAIMYAYYGATIAFKGNKTLAAMRPFITLSQLVQMFFGAAICVHELVNPCAKGLQINAFLGFAMYVSYAYLFGDFFVNNYKKHMNSIDTLFAITPIVFMPVIIYGIGWKDLFFNPWTTTTAFGLTCLFSSFLGSGPLPFLSPICYAGMESDHYGVDKRAVRAFARREKIDNNTYARWLQLAMRYTLLPNLAILVDSVATRHLSIRSLPVIFCFWSIHGYLSGAFGIKEQRSDPNTVLDTIEGVSTVDRAEVTIDVSAPSTPTTSASRENAETVTQVKAPLGNDRTAELRERVVTTFNT